MNNIPHCFCLFVFSLQMWCWCWQVTTTATTYLEHRSTSARMMSTWSWSSTTPPACTTTSPTMPSSLNRPPSSQRSDRYDIIIIIITTVLMDVNDSVCLVQIVKGIKYFVDFQISRTVCRKKRVHTDLSRCDFQPEGLLRQVGRRS